jgi:hypothetical protein
MTHERLWRMTETTRSSAIARAYPRESEPPRGMTLLRVDTLG